MKGKFKGRKSSRWKRVRAESRSLRLRPFIAREFVKAFNDLVWGDHQSKPLYDTYWPSQIKTGV